MHAKYMNMTLHAKEKISIPSSILLLLPLLLCPTSVVSDDNVPIPPTKDQVNTWFTANVKPLASRKDLDPGLVKAEANVSHIKNSAPRPDGKKPNQQAVAVTQSGDKASYYNCKMKGFQDTFCDNVGRHFFKDCYIEGTVDFVFGDGKSLYVNTELHVIEGDNMAVVTAHGRHTNAEDTAYSFAHCKVTGKGTGGLLGRGWKPFSRVIISYTEIGNCIKPEGWSGMRGNPTNGGTTFFGEYKNTGPGSNMKTRPKFVRRLTDPEVRPYLTLGFIEASKWLLPPTKV
ncbi:unnamed protein product [Cuscuta europaea]|uniref:Pectinesterase n=1 Tax=Cuscuta europaea TaxID=41803 RepID=A0A9P0YJ85_CUSEU|nr:unnamed protein product [Cuscuta europaea]